MIARLILPVLLLVSCGAPPTPERVSTLPDRAEAVVLLATLGEGHVTVEGAVLGAAQHVDLDRPDDDLYAFRYQIKDGDEVLYERSTSGPVLVDAFLAYWSGVSGVDILDSLPTLGRFPIVVPLLDGADEVQFQLRRDDGTYANAGSWTITDAASLDVGLADDILAGHATLHESGPSENRLDIVIIGDGYTESEQDLFEKDARQLKNELLRTEPFTSLADYLNVHRVNVVSAESGASYDCAGGPCEPVDNALGSIFAIELVNLFSGASYDSRAIFQADQWRVAQAVSVVPWDHVIVLVNTPAFGGMAVHYATATTGMSDWKETGVHELAHVLGQLGDEYVFDDCIRSDALGLPPNITDEPAHPPWAHWIEPNTALPSVGDDEDVVGAFAGAYNCDDLHRPQASCMMRDNGPFCAVCSEQLVRRILGYADPVDAVAFSRKRPLTATVVGVREGLTVRWLVDGEERGTATVGEELRVGSGDALTIEVREPTPLVRAHRGELLQVLEYALD